jgi:hypothetical protein
MLRPANRSDSGLTGPPDTPTARGSNARPGHRGHATITNQAAPPTIRDRRHRAGDGPRRCIQPGAAASDR